MNIRSLGYVRVQSPEAKQWSDFGPNVLGMALSEDPLGRADTVALTVDDRPGRLQVCVGESNRLECLGWELAGVGAFERAVVELRAAGVEVVPGSEEDRARGVPPTFRIADLIKSRPNWRQIDAGETPEI